MWRRGVPNKHTHTHNGRHNDRRNLFGLFGFCASININVCCSLRTRTSSTPEFPGMETNKYQLITRDYSKMCKKLWLSHISRHVELWMRNIQHLRYECRKMKKNSFVKNKTKKNVFGIFQTSCSDETIDKHYLRVNNELLTETTITIRIPQNHFPKYDNKFFLPQMIKSFPFFFRILTHKNALIFKLFFLHRTLYSNSKNHRIRQWLINS